MPIDIVLPRLNSYQKRRIHSLMVFTMSKKIPQPKSRKEHDQMKRGKINNHKSVSDNDSIIDKCKKLIRRNNSES